MKESLQDGQGAVLCLVELMRWCLYGLMTEHVLVLHSLSDSTANQLRTGSRACTISYLLNRIGSTLTCDVVEIHGT